MGTEIGEDLVREHPDCNNNFGYRIGSALYSEVMNSPKIISTMKT